MDQYCLLVYGHINFLNDGCCHYFSKTSVSSLFCSQIELFFWCAHVLRWCYSTRDYGWLLLWQWGQQSTLHWHPWYMAPTLEFLPFNIDNGAVLDCHNSLILCWCLGADGYRYVVHNLMTQKFNILPPSTHDVGHSISEAHLGFDPTASSHFHVIEYVDVNAMCTGVEIYSSQTTAWIYKEFE